MIDDLDADALEVEAEDRAVDARLGDFSDHSGRGAASTGAVLYDIVRDAGEPITVGEVVERWVAQASEAALGHVRRYAAHRRKTGTPRATCFSPDVRDARRALREALAWLVRAGRLRRLDGRIDARGLFDALVEPGTPPRVYGEGGRVVAYDEAERARRAAESAEARAQLRGGAIADQLARLDAATVHRLASQVHRRLALAAQPEGEGPDVAIARASVVRKRLVPTDDLRELELILDEIERWRASRGGSS